MKYPPVEFKPFFIKEYECVDFEKTLGEWKSFIESQIKYYGEDAVLQFDCEYQIDLKLLRYKPFLNGKELVPKEVVDNTK
jgi:hypothetical protein